MAAIDHRFDIWEARLAALDESWDLRWEAWARAMTVARWPWPDLIAWLEHDNRANPQISRDRVPFSNRWISDRTGINYQTVGRWAARGWLTDRHADEVATRLGVHPETIWPAWLSTAPERVGV